MRRGFIAIALLCGSAALAQNDHSVSLNGSVQSDMMLFPQQDEAIGTSEYDNDTFLTNTYVNLILQSRYVDAGARLEFTQFPMPGYQDAYNQFKGWGVPNVWVKGRLNTAEITLGSFYEQFGSGFILRSYEERSLGIDNALNGAHVLWTPMRGLQVKALSGFQRNYWEWDTQTLVSGTDAELAVEEWIPFLQERDSRLSLGGSWVNKREDPNEVIFADPTHRLNLPEFVNAYDLRARYQKSGLALLAEYAHKSQDPNELNSYIYGEGHAEMLSATYGRKGLSLLGQVRRSENMGFRSHRSASALSNALYINHQPAFTLDQTYALAALYPYATQAEGEWAYQASAGYKWKGKNGPKVKLNYSRVNGLEQARLNRNNAAMRGTDGAESDFFTNGDTYYQDLDVQLEKKFGKQLDLHLMYMYQEYNKTIIQNEGGMICSHIVVVDGKYKFNRRYTLRAEAQYLGTAHESGDWGFGLVELSVAPYLMFTVSDMVGRCEPESGVYGDVTHYYQAMVTGNIGSHRLQMGFGRTRAGYNCNGGVCRYIPASKGLMINYNYNY